MGFLFIFPSDIKVLGVSYSTQIDTKPEEVLDKDLPSSGDQPDSGTSANGLWDQW